MTALRLGTRGSQLALWQAGAVATAIEAAGGPVCEIVSITTRGDRAAEARLADIGGKRVFVKEIEDALLDGRIDLAVHSAKDLPAELPDGLRVAGVLPREDPRDALVLPAGRPAGEFLGLIRDFDRCVRVGTGSVRRVAQLKRLMPAARFCDVRGNLDTRLRKLDEGLTDVLVLAVAGLQRLGWEHRVSARIPVDACVPSPGQGTVAIETRSDNRPLLAIVGMISDGGAEARLRAERALGAGLGGGCQLPVGALAREEDGQLHLMAIVTSLDGSQAIRGDLTAPIGDATRLGSELAGRLLAEGAAQILEEVRRTQVSSAVPRLQVNSTTSD